MSLHTAELLGSAVVIYLVGYFLNAYLVQHGRADANWGAVFATGYFCGGLIGLWIGLPS